MFIDPNYDYKLDSNKKDPDRYSKKLKEDSCKLWSRSLNNSLFNLEVKNNKIVGTYKNNVFYFSNDCITNCYEDWKQLKQITQNPKFKNIKEEYYKIGYILSMTIIFPINDDFGSSKQTINMARGISKHIKDRFDYTLECIRLYFINEDSPLSNCLKRYSKFFGLFNNFKEYVKFFYLDDLVNKDYTKVIGFTGSIDFNNPLPSENNYEMYVKNVINFVNKRSIRIKDDITKKAPNI